MSLWDPQEQNTKSDLVGSGSDLFQIPPPGAFSRVDNDFEHTEAAKELMKREREWHVEHLCAKCGICKHRCRCNVRAPIRWGHGDRRSEFLKIPGKKKKIYDDDALPRPWRAKQNQKLLDEMKDCKFRLVVVCPENS